MLFILDHKSEDQGLVFIHESLNNVTAWTLELGRARLESGSVFTSFVNW